MAVVVREGEGEGDTKPHMLVGDTAMALVVAGTAPEGPARAAGRAAEGNGRAAAREPGVELAGEDNA